MIVFFCFSLFASSCGHEIRGKTTLPPYDMYFITDWWRSRTDDPYLNVGPLPFKKKKYQTEVDNRQAEIMVNLTAELIKDCQMKLRHQQVIQEEYQKDENFELGLIAATVMEKFTHMVQIYQFVIRPDYWQDIDNMEITSNIIRSYQVMFSDYNEIRMEKNLFFERLKQNSKKRAEEKRRKEQEEEERKKKKMAAMEEGPKEISWSDLAQFSPSELSAMKQAYGYRRSGLLTNATVQQAHEEYKRALRQAKWMEKWKGFNPDREGIPVGKQLAKVGLQNNSDFLGLNPF